MQMTGLNFSTKGPLLHLLWVSLPAAQGFGVRVLDQTVESAGSENL